jgi:hypothetical protein
LGCEETVGGVKKYLPFDNNGWHPLLLLVVVKAKSGCDHPVTHQQITPITSLLHT